MKEHFITQRKSPWLNTNTVGPNIFPLYIDGHGNVCVPFISEKHLQEEKHTKSNLV